MEATYDPMEFSACFFNGFHVSRLQRRKGNQVCFVTALSKETHPTPSMNISAIGKITDSHLDSAFGSLRLANANAQRFKHQRGAPQECSQRGLQSCASLARLNLRDSQFQFDIGQPAGDLRPERAYLRVAFERQ